MKLQRVRTRAPGGSCIFRHILLCFLALALLGPTAFASSRSISADWARVGKPKANAKIVLIEPDLELSELTAGGSAEPRADWSEAAKRLYPVAVRRMLAERGANLVDDYRVPAELAPDARERQIIALHQAVGISILRHHFGQPRLATKTKALDYTLGAGARALREATGADYAVFTYVRDSYTSAGRAAMMVFGALLGVGLSGGIQLGFTSMVDLDSGQVVWFDFLVDQSGDLRDEKGVKETVGDLFKGFPL